ncbi:hypothetical protein GMA19_02613 [Paenibacillus polymyxa E681]|uniref:hypothetical protein n=1 Tax=Paenibacillus polymyxa TaxID=1406 RepID=UPI0005C4ED3B|nr:hypothetical protein [Paenibacillus polymyxa]AJW69250.1 hypothetical protein PPE_05915 [Paenibacillus polymyxa E681]QNV57443.1 hypothetical protein GE561_02613 [Paenibacillus polymyxa E681]QNV62280.1 hypothetical protein GMA19_02613 [Paenibacillus polymyxa E681]
MRVCFVLREKGGISSGIHDTEVDLDEAQIFALFNSDEVYYPKSIGVGSRKRIRVSILEKTFSLFDKERPFLKVVLQELD